MNYIDNFWIYLVHVLTYLKKYLHIFCIEQVYTYLYTKKIDLTI